MIINHLLASLVCPARAGMIRVRASWRTTARRLPRTRGDDPKLLTYPYAVFEFAPHARG